MLLNGGGLIMEDVRKFKALAKYETGRYQTMQNCRIVLNKNMPHVNAWNGGGLILCQGVESTANMNTSKDKAFTLAS